jgi:hypothetical protein
MKIMKDISCYFEFSVQFYSNLNLDLIELNSNSIGFRFNWREMGCKFLHNVLKKILGSVAKRYWFFFLKTHFLSIINWELAKHISIWKSSKADPSQGITHGL